MQNLNHNNLHEYGYTFIIGLLFVFVEAVFFAPRSEELVLFPSSFPGRFGSVAISQWPLTPVSAQRIHCVILSRYGRVENRILDQCVQKQNRRGQTTAQVLWTTSQLWSDLILL